MTETYRFTRCFSIIQPGTQYFHPECNLVLGLSCTAKAITLPMYSFTRLYGSKFFYQQVSWRNSLHATQRSRNEEISKFVYWCSYRSSPPRALPPQITDCRSLSLSAAHTAHVWWLGRQQACPFRIENNTEILVHGGGRYHIQFRNYI